MALQAGKGNDLVKRKHRQNILSDDHLAYGLASVPPLDRNLDASTASAFYVLTLQSEVSYKMI
jgi:hypothetical protein